MTAVPRGMDNICLLKKLRELATMVRRLMKPSMEIKQHGNLECEAGRNLCV